MWFRYNAAPFWLTHKWEEYAVELRSAYQELSRQRSAVQTLADDATDFDFRRVQVEWSPHGSPDGSPGPTWDVRIQPGLSSKAQRTYQNARLVYDTITLPLGLASKAKNLREIQVRDFGKEWLEDKVEDVILKSMVEIANHVGDLGERLFYMASGSSPARKTGLTQDQAYALANSMRQEYWSIARRAAPFVESYNAEVAAFNAARQAFLADLNATGELTDYEKMLVRDRLLLPIGPINVPAIPSAPEYLSVPGKPLLNPQGLDVIRVDPNGSMTLPPASVFPSPEAQVGLYSFDYAPASDGFAATGSTPGAVFHRWTQRGFDGQLLRVIHAGNSGDPGPEEIVVDGGDPANSGIYSRTALSEDGQILSVDTFQVLVGTLGGAPAEVDLLPAQLDHAAGTPLLLAPIVRSETVYGLDWFKNGTLIASNVGSLSFLGGVGIADSGVYEVSVTNGGGSVLSQPFVLSVRTIAAPLVTVPRARLDSRRARPVRATATVRNTGPSPDAILVRGSRGNRFFRVTYASGSNVTAPMLAGIFSLGVRAVGDLPVPVSARVVPNRRALVRGGRTVRRTFNLDFRATAATTGSSHQRRVRIGTR